MRVNMDNDSFVVVHFWNDVNGQFWFGFKELTNDHSSNEGTLLVCNVCQLRP